MPRSVTFRDGRDHRAEHSGNEEIKAGHSRSLKPFKGVLKEQMM